MSKPFEHLQAAHCENGVAANLLRMGGVANITEPLAFGIGSGIFFVMIPFTKVNDGPAISYRTMPGLIFKRLCKRLGVKVKREKFSNPQKGMQRLDEFLNMGMPVGAQVGVYYLTYFPKEYRFHFNAHNLIVYGKEGDEYLISDPIMEYETRLTSYELERVRFAKGFLAPKGQLYYAQVIRPITDDDIRKGIEKGVRGTVRDMLKIPGNIAGVKGIIRVANKIKKWPKQLGDKKARLYLAQMVRMQEEIGTGGGGFRYLYAAFLQEAYAYLPKEEFKLASPLFTRAGDRWRDAAVQAAGIYKGRLGSQADYDKLAEYLYQIAAIEKEAFTILSQIKW